MSDIKWTLFSESLPSTDTQHVYITDFLKVFVERKFWADIGWEYEQSRLQNCAWAEIPIPKVPKQVKKLHSCRTSDVICE